MIYQTIGKRILDIILAVIGLLVGLPIFLTAVIILGYANRGNIFFIQKRPGRNEKIFRLIKLKSMNDNTDINGNLLPDDERLTYIGELIRKTSLDEFPQLINVLKGDMSLVGPRPLLVEYLPMYSSEQKRRHSLKPGITGWAQVSGRNSLNWTNKFEQDLYYVDNISLMFDIKIILLTIIKVFRTEGISQKGYATMPKFTGND